MNIQRIFYHTSFIIIILAFATVNTENAHTLVKRQLPFRDADQSSFPLSRSRQYPPPEELDEELPEDQGDDTSYEANPPPARRYTSLFRGRQQPPEEGEEINPEEYIYTEVPQTTTPLPTKPPNRISAFNRVSNRPRFGASPNTPASTTALVERNTISTRSRGRLTSAPAQRIDVAAEILNKPPAPRQSSRNSISYRSTTKENFRKPLLEGSSTAVPIATRRVSNDRTRPRGRYRTRTSSTTTTTTTTTTPPPEEYYYYYYDEEDEAKQPIITSSTTTTTTTTAKPPTLPRRPSLARKPSNARAASTQRAPVKFDLESQFQPPPDDIPVTLESRTTKKFTTTSTTTSAPGGIPPHLRSKYKPREDGRFVDYLRDPNRPRELKGFDLSDYPFYVRVPDDIDFDCEDKKDGYYASVPHHCQLFHYCFAGSRYDFLCANYTLYDQTTFTCRFANNVDCPSSEKFYYRNDDLWKETTTTTTTEAPKKKKVVKDLEEDYEEEAYDDEYDDEEDEERRPPRPRRRRNRRRKNRRKPAEDN